MLESSFENIPVAGIVPLWKTHVDVQNAMQDPLLVSRCRWNWDNSSQSIHVPEFWWRELLSKNSNVKPFDVMGQHVSNAFFWDTSFASQCICGNIPKRRPGWNELKPSAVGIGPVAMVLKPFVVAPLKKSGLNLVYQRFHWVTWGQMSQRLYLKTGRKFSVNLLSQLWVEAALCHPSRLVPS